jgi:DNA repair exonuclease SbcCD ATPase subunit
MAGFVGFDEGATGPPRPWEVGYGGNGGFGGGSLPMVRDAVQVAMVVNAGQRREMGHLNLVAVRHRKRMMVGRVTAVEERLALVERKLRGEEKSDSEDGEAVSEEPAVSKEFRVKIVCGEDKRLMLVPLGVEVHELEEMVEKELNLGIAFTLKVVMHAGNVVPLTSRDVLAQALADTGWISRPSTSAISARNAEPRRPLSRGRSRDAKTLQMLVYTMVDKEREEAEAAVEAANQEREEAEAAEREAARELAEAEAAEAEAERHRLEAEAAAHLNTKEEEEAQAAEEEALAKEELAEEALLKAQTAKATLAAAEKQLSELQARQGPKTPEHLDKIKAAQDKVEEAATALAEAGAAAEEAQRARDEAVADAERERREADEARLQAELAQELAEETAQMAAREREEAEAAQRVAEKERQESNAAQAEATNSEKSSMYLLYMVNILGR